MSAFFKTHHRQMRRQYEGADYFRKLILNSFAYKENEVIDAVKKDLKSHLELYHRLNKYITPKAKILHLGNDYGQLLSQQDSQRTIDVFIADEQKRSVAKTNYMLRKRAISYADDLNEMAGRKYDFILISNTTFEADFCELAKDAENIILIDNPSLKNTITDCGFEAETGEAQLVVLKKK